MKQLPKNVWKQLQSQAKETLGGKFWEDLSGLVPKDYPRMDLFETKQEYVAVLEMPGLHRAEQIRASTNGRQLTVEGEVTYDYPVESDAVIHSERYFGSFRRMIPLPKLVYAGRVRAIYKNGLLVIHLYKMPEETEQSIPIEYQP
ncbi:Hsp20/alpha crystallin family protein [Paenibacillus turpanensis]|uniref:Hsp20/alpha crystallin family protein n=1 Tax=Paenibacillus turpanensis TaxID=2689078 RepID=UPI0014092EC9|nr:Hsp20/alpha crystallin family protein [Paenibacillus turpanensis]